MIDGPDFICIGLPKAGTGWLFDQLDDHPDFWMPPVKELMYLAEAFPRMPYARDKPAREGKSRGERRVHRQIFDARDEAFLAHAREHRRGAMNLDVYAGLFAAKGALLSGDVSPPYWTLDPGTIERVAARFPATRIVLLVRDPVARAWSRISMAWRSDLFDAALLDDAEGFKDYIVRTKKIGRLFATEVAQRWRKHAPAMALGIFLFDDVEQRPESARRDILAFLGADPGKPSHTRPAGHNRKADEKKLAMTPAARAVLAEHFAQELRASGSAFGGAAQEWAGKYGV
jgi:hypothetical protein